MNQEGGSDDERFGFMKHLESWMLESRTWKLRLEDWFDFGGDEFLGLGMTMELSQSHGPLLFFLAC